MKVTIFTDGGARGNPGPGAAGVVIKDSEGKIIKELARFLGVCTNNEAEYHAILLGLNSACKLDSDEVECFLDSELVVKQLRGEYRVKNVRLKEVFNQVKTLEKNFKRATYKHIPREKNVEADALVNEILDSSLKS